MEQNLENKFDLNTIIRVTENQILKNQAKDI